MRTIEDIVGAARLRERTVTLCLRGDLTADYEQLERELRRAEERWTPTALDEPNPALDIARRMAELREAMLEAEHPFRFRALPRSRYRAVEDACPPRDGVDERYDMSRFPQELIAASAVDPELTPADVDKLFEVLSEGQRDELFLGAWDVNIGRGDVPFSSRASALTRSYAQS